MSYDIPPDESYMGPRLDAPSLRTRMAALAAAQGQALSPDQLRRLARRQRAEERLAERAIAAGHSPSAALKGTLEDYLVQTPFSRARQRLTEAATNQQTLAAELAASPEAMDAARQRILADAMVAEETMSAPAREARRLGYLASSSSALDQIDRQGAADREIENAAVQRAVLEQGYTPQQARAMLNTPVRFEADTEAAPAAPVAAPEVAEDDPRPDFSVAQKALFKGTEIDRRRMAQQAAREFYSGTTTSALRAAQLTREFSEKALQPVEREVTYVNKNTGLRESFKQTVDGLGNVLAVSPVETQKDEVTKGLDAEFAKKLAEWETVGRANIESQLRNLAKADRNLQKAGLEAALQSGAIAGLPVIKNVVDQFTVLPQETERLVLDTAQRSLREILGAQFAKAEGEQFLARAYNRSAKEGTNRQFVLGLIDTLEEQAKARENMADYYAKNGTLAGYRGPRVVTDLESLEKRIQGSAAPGQPAAPALPDPAKRYMDKYARRGGAGASKTE